MEQPLRDGSTHLATINHKSMIYERILTTHRVPHRIAAAIPALAESIIPVFTISASSFIRPNWY
ncbi:hypothetical protein [Chitinimonas koreensis]|uniref:hypothetical protein n=1 Tax=Chitinimonas koreensis TaxID=356302 RepID=UPI001654379D|nr:hypothetical protein [Chitinimonas koreensis]QNM95916.1 hypothetical protein H9L41_19125 [Chitinimonas koreensis]